ncbi:MAG: HEPN domain-containing protein [Elusimicrobiota bacterium]
MANKLKIKINLLLKNVEERMESAEALYKLKNYKDAISRAYYAMHDVTLAILLTKNITPKTHSGILKMFNFHFIKTKKIEYKYYKLLANAYDMRENGDYEVFYEATEEETRQLIDNAAKFIEKIKEILAKEEY